MKIKIVDEDRIQKHLDYQAKMLDIIEDDFINTQEKLRAQQPIPVIMAVDKQQHAHERSIERCVSRQAILQVLQKGFIIEAHKEGNSTFRLLICQNTPSTARPLHVVCVYSPRNEEIIIVTVYDPRSKSELWRNNYAERVFYKTGGTL